MSTWRCEVLRAWEDMTWDTEIIDVPVSIDPDRCLDSEVENYWLKKYGGLPANRKIILVRVYNIFPEESDG